MTAETEMVTLLDGVALALAYTAAREVVEMVPTRRLRRAEHAWRRRAANPHLDPAARVAWVAARDELLARGRQVTS